MVSLNPMVEVLVICHPYQPPSYSVQNDVTDSFNVFFLGYFCCNPVLTNLVLNAKLN